MLRKKQELKYQDPLQCGGSGCVLNVVNIRFQWVWVIQRRHTQHAWKSNMEATDSCNTTFGSRTTALTSAAFRAAHRSESEPSGQSFSLKVQKTHSFHSLGVAYEQGGLNIEF